MQGAYAHVGLRFQQHFGYGIIVGRYSKYVLPSGEITLYAEDVHGASSVRRISFVLCACDNGGTCVEVYTNETIEFNEHGHFKEICLCPEYYGGESCEIDLRGCRNNACPYRSICVDNSSLPSGYYCSGCATGYVFYDNKCIGKTYP